MDVSRTTRAVPAFELEQHSRVLEPPLDLTALIPLCCDIGASDGAVRPLGVQEVLDGRARRDVDVIATVGRAPAVDVDPVVLARQLIAVVVKEDDQRHVLQVPRIDVTALIPLCRDVGA